MFYEWKRAPQEKPNIDEKKNHPYEETDVINMERDICFYEWKSAHTILWTTFHSSPTRVKSPLCVSFHICVSLCVFLFTYVCLSFTHYPHVAFHVYYVSFHTDDYSFHLYTQSSIHTIFCTTTWTTMIEKRNHPYEKRPNTHRKRPTFSEWESAQTILWMTTLKTMIASNSLFIGVYNRDQMCS